MMASEKTAASRADSKIENALLKKATGYTVDVAKSYKLRRVEYEDGKKVCEFEELAQGVDQVHVPADLSAQIFWLKNRMPEKWQDKPDAGKLSLLKLDEMLGDFKHEAEHRVSSSGAPAGAGILRAAQPEAVKPSSITGGQSL